jgi:hypothetical protein
MSSIIALIIDKVSTTAVGGPLVIVGRAIWWFYGTFIPFIVKWIGIPMFLLGVILAVAFAGGTVLFVIVFFIVMYYFIKQVFFKTHPKVT